MDKASVYRLTSKQLKSLLMDINYPGRSRLTAKDAMIEALDRHGYFTSAEPERTGSRSAPAEPATPTLAATGLNDLPTELVFQILYGLDSAEIVKLCRTNREYEKVCRTPIFWANKAQLDFGYPTNRFLDPQAGQSLSGYQKYQIVQQVYLAGISYIYGDRSYFSYPQHPNPETTPFQIEVSLFYYNPDGDSIVKAAKRGDLESVTLLMQHPEGINPNNSEKLLMAAIKRNNLELVSILLTDPRIDPSVSDNEAIDEAASNGLTEIVRLLLSDPRVDPRDSLSIAASDGHVETVKLLLNDPRVDPSEHNNRALRVAVVGSFGNPDNHLEVVKILLADPRVDPGANDNELIIYAAGNGWLPMVKLLAEDPRTNPLAQNEQAKRRAVANNHREVIKYLLNWRHEHGRGSRG